MSDLLTRHHPYSTAASVSFRLRFESRKSNPESHEWRCCSLPLLSYVVGEGATSTGVGHPTFEGLGFGNNRNELLHSTRACHLVSAISIEGVCWIALVRMAIIEAHCMARLFTPKIANYYEDFYQSKGVKFLKGNVLTSFDFDVSGKVTAVNLKDGSILPADIFVIGIGIRPNTSLFEGQLTMDKGGIKVNGKMQSSNSSVYAMGDVASFPVKIFGETRRLEHVDSARKAAKHAVTAIMEPEKTGEFVCLPFFYSRVFTLSWQFYGDNAGEAVYFGDFSGNAFGAYWIF